MQIYHKCSFLKIGLIPILIVYILINNQLYAQIGGQSTYEFLNLTNSARLAALGGEFVSVRDNDISLMILNPSLINDEVSGDITFSFVDYYADINYGFASYAKSYDKIGSFAASVQYVNYGSFDYADYTGTLQGNFTASEFALVLGWGRKLDEKFSIGANLKFIYSSLESYKSYGVGTDIAISYHHEFYQFSSSLIFKNIGRQLKSYRSSNAENLPFEIQFALSKKMYHVPFRLHLVLTHMEKWDLTYQNPLYVQSVIGESQNNIPKAGFTRKLMSHVVIGGEFLVNKKFTVRIGYNYRRRQEMKVESKYSLVGFSWGFGFKISNFQFDYARSTYHLIGSPNYITISTNVNRLFGK